MSKITIATWNVNSIRARIEGVTQWLQQAKPDIALLQELKCQDEQFPAEAISDAGYDAKMIGQKSYNGVAILYKKGLSPEITERAMPGDENDAQARYIEARLDGMTFASIYLPNGNPVPGEKFDYKIAWMKRLADHAQKLLDSHSPIVLGGDYNLIPEDRDVWEPKAMEDDALARPESRKIWRQIVNMGYTDAFRALDDRAGQYSYWDYKAARYQRDEGFRIDHFLLSPEAADRMLSCRIDTAPRGWEKASDHTPVILTLETA